MISANIIACNEEARLRWCIEQVRPFVDEVVVVVQQSEDNTLGIARELADVVIEHPKYGFCEASRPAAVAASHGDWILALDADEALSCYGMAHLHEWVAGGADFLYLRRLTLIDGVELEDMAHGRLFRPTVVDIPTTIHTCYLPLSCAAATINSHVVIEHFKTTGEQHADDLRYREIMPDYVQRHHLS